MGRMYTVQFEAISVSAQVDFFEIVTASTKPAMIHAIFLSQSSEVGDAAEEFMRVQIIRDYTTSGSGGTTTTPVPLDPIGVGAGFACETNNTTLATGGTPLILHSEAFNERTGWAYIPTPEMRLKVAGSQRIVVRLMAAPADAVTMSGTMYVEEAP